MISGRRAGAFPNVGSSPGEVWSVRHERFNDMFLLLRHDGSWKREGCVWEVVSLTTGEQQLWDFERATSCNKIERIA